MLTITLTRNKGLYARARALQIYADDVLIGSVRSGETVSLSIPKGALEIYAKMDWAKTNSVAVSDLVEGSALEANARFTLNPLLMLGVGGIPIHLETTFS